MCQNVSTNANMFQTNHNKGTNDTTTIISHVKENGKLHGCTKAGTHVKIHLHGNP